METKTRKKREPKYATEIERINAERATKRKSNKKNKPVKIKVIPVHENFNDQYRLGLFRYLIMKNFQSMITLTHRENVTLKQHETIVNKMLQKLSAKGFFTCFFKVNEIHNYRYHSHILVEDAGVAKSLTGLIKRYWKDYGNADVQRIKSNPDKYRFVSYCLKQLKPMDRRHHIQALIDTWNYYQLPIPIIEVDLFVNKAFLASLRQERDYIYDRPTSSLIVPEMTIMEAFNRLQTKLNSRKSIKNYFQANYI